MKNKLLAVVLFMIVSLGASASDTKEDATVRATELIQRVEHFRSLDKSEMTRAEKQEMKQELRSIKKELRHLESTQGLDDKVSISIGAIIIIILVLILV